MKLSKENIFTIAAVVIILAVVILRVTGVSGGGTTDFTAVSSVELGHSHVIQISGRDVDRPPKERIITSSSDGSPRHTHVIALSESDFRSLKAGAELIIPSPPSTPDNHTHTFQIKVPPAG